MEAVFHGLERVHQASGPLLEKPARELTRAGAHIDQSIDVQGVQPSPFLAAQPRRPLPLLGHVGHVVDRRIEQTSERMLSLLPTGSQRVLAQCLLRGPRSPGGGLRQISIHRQSLCRRLPKNDEHMVTPVTCVRIPL